MSFAYPAPTITAELDYEALRDQRFAAFVAQWNGYRARNPNAGLPEFTTTTLANSMEAIALGAAADGDFYFVGRANAVARAAVLVDFAYGPDLDLHGLDTRVPGHPEGVTRHPEEGDEDYAARIREARAGSSAAGPDDWWLTHARAADSRVRSIGLDYKGLGELEIYVLSKDNGGIPDEAMIEAVTERLMRKNVRPRTATPIVKSAIIAEIDVVAYVWLHPEASESRLDILKAAALAQNEKDQALDRDLTHHYLKRLIDAPDVYDIAITSPATDLPAGPSRAYAIRSMELILAGRNR